jgi:hypothetical protein
MKRNRVVEKAVDKGIGSFYALAVCHGGIDMVDDMQ